MIEISVGLILFSFLGIICSFYAWAGCFAMLLELWKPIEIWHGVVLALAASVPVWVAWLWIFEVIVFVP
jgi:hypothetical protein